MTQRTNASRSVSIGAVTGGIKGSQIAAGDISDSKASATQSTVADNIKPSIEELTKLLETIKTELASLSSQHTALTAVSASAPSGVKGAQDCVEAVTTKLKPDASEEDKASVVSEITEAESLISRLMQNTTKVLKGASQISQSGKPLVDQLSPLLQHLSQAATWIGQIWP